MVRPTPKTDLQRVADGLRKDQADYHEAVVQLVGSIETRVTEIQREIRIEGFERQRVQSEVTDLRSQIGELRDLVRLRKREDATDAASAAVQEVRPVMEATAVKTAKEAAKHTARLNRVQWSALVGIVFISLVQFIEKGPAVARAVIAFVKGLAELD